MTVPRRQVELLEKNRPRQERAKRTYEAILNSAAELLVEVGVERISTNLIAERAGITVPALYRYFPNKYAVINALGAVLMDRQNQVFQQWFDTHTPGADPRQLMSHVYDLLQHTYEVTLEQHGGLEISQSLRAVGPLQELRLTSHNLMAEQFALILSEVLGQAVDETMSMQARMSVDIGYGVVEMALENPADQVELILQEGTRILQSYWEGILQAQEEA
jgi:AcrR family transcriptional regulator